LRVYVVHKIQCSQRGAVLEANASNVDPMRALTQMRVKAKTAFGFDEDMFGKVREPALFMQSRTE